MTRPRLEPIVCRERSFAARERSHAVPPMFGSHRRTRFLMLEVALSAALSGYMGSPRRRAALS